MNTLAAPEGKWLTSVDDTREPILIKEAYGNGALDKQYRDATGYDYYKTLKSNELTGGGNLVRRPH